MPSMNDFFYIVGFLSSLHHPHHLFVIMSTIAEQADSLLDFSGKLDIQLLDNVINCMYKGQGQQVSASVRQPSSCNIVDIIIDMVLHVCLFGLHVLQNNSELV